ncbi:hypothetical protein IGI37_002135 [Enterococcus sp. AZ194]|uniref:hypothetical protein n=1 Tax=Enterococcus sp. AZ194 TaxID=2774629 RepID=UPI003F24CBD0
MHLTGTVSKIKILTYSPQPLVRFTLQAKDQVVNCLIATHSLTFLAEVEDQMTILIAGTLNARNQFVTRNYRVLGKTKIMYEFENSRYPKSHSLF